MIKIAGGQAAMASQMLELSVQAIYDNAEVEKKLSGAGKYLYIVEDCFKTLDLSFCLDYLGEVRTVIESPLYDGIENILYETLRGLQKAFIVELDSKGLYLFTSEEYKLYKNPHPFGRKTAKHFGALKIDIDEANKCYAAGRYTASVIHCMRIIEYAVEKLAVASGIPLIDKNNQPMGWHKLLDAVEAKLNKFRDRTDPKKERFYEDSVKTISHLYLVKTLRNSVAHPKRHFEEYEAKTALNETSAYLKDMIKITTKAKRYLLAITI